MGLAIAIGWLCAWAVASARVYPRFAPAQGTRQRLLWELADTALLLLSSLGVVAVVRALGI